MDYARLFAYATGSVFISFGAVLFTYNLMPFAMGYGWPGGIALLLGYGIIYFNLIFVITKRFIRRELTESKASLILMLITALPPMVFLVLNQLREPMPGLAYVLLGVILGVAVGYHFGVRSGRRLQNEYLQKLKQLLDEKGLPEELQRPHDKLNKN
jgi:uncharacterized membrane protein YoaK (UPF0700 family)